MLTKKIIQNPTHLCSTEATMYPWEARSHVIPLYVVRIAPRPWENTRAGKVGGASGPSGPSMTQMTRSSPRSVKQTVNLCFCDKTITSLALYTYL